MGRSDDASTLIDSSILPVPRPNRTAVHDSNFFFPHKRTVPSSNVASPYMNDEAANAIAAGFRRQ